MMVIPEINKCSLNFFCLKVKRNFWGDSQKDKLKKKPSDFINQPAPFTLVQLTPPFNFLDPSRKLLDCSNFEFTDDTQQHFSNHYSKHMLHTESFKDFVLHNASLKWFAGVPNDNSSYGPSFSGFKSKNLFIHHKRAANNRFFKNNSKNIPNFTNKSFGKHNSGFLVHSLKFKQAHLHKRQSDQYFYFPQNQLSFINDSYTNFPSHNIPRLKYSHLSTYHQMILNSQKSQKMPKYNPFFPNPRFLNPLSPFLQNQFLLMRESTRELLLNEVLKTSGFQDLSLLLTRKDYFHDNREKNKLFKNTDFNIHKNNNVDSNSNYDKNFHDTSCSIPLFKMQNHFKKNHGRLLTYKFSFGWLFCEKVEILNVDVSAFRVVYKNCVEKIPPKNCDSDYYKDSGAVHLKSNKACNNEKSVNTNITASAFDVPYMRNTHTNTFKKSSCNGLECQFKSQKLQKNNIHNDNEGFKEKNYSINKHLSTHYTSYNQNLTARYDRKSSFNHEGNDEKLQKFNADKTFRNGGRTSELGDTNDIGRSNEAKTFNFTLKYRCIEHYNNHKHLLFSVIDFEWEQSGKFSSNDERETYEFPKKNNRTKKIEKNKKLKFEKTSFETPSTSKKKARTKYGIESISRLSYGVALNCWVFDETNFDQFFFVPEHFCYQFELENFDENLFLFLRKNTFTSTSQESLSFQVHMGVFTLIEKSLPSDHLNSMSSQTLENYSKEKMLEFNHRINNLNLQQSKKYSDTLYNHHSKHHRHFTPSNPKTQMGFLEKKHQNYKNKNTLQKFKWKKVDFSNDCNLREIKKLIIIYALFIEIYFLKNLIH